jgi:predicted anti-sigma-YlaC factor YlaD
MNCHEAVERITDQFDVDDKQGDWVSLSDHLENCSDCRVLFQQEQETFRTLRPIERIAATQHFKERVVKAIIEESDCATFGNSGFRS